MFPILQVGPLAIQAPGLFLLIGVWLGLNLAEKRAIREGIPASEPYNLAFLSIIVGIVAGRLAYVARYPSIFISEPFSVISFNMGLFDLEAAFLFGILAALIHGQRKKLSFWPTLDTLTPAFAVMGVALGFAHLASGDAFGAPSGLPWAIELWGARRHPTQVYEIILALAILWVVWPSRPVRPPLPGARITTFIVLTAGSRLIIEAFRGDSILIGPGLRLAQIAAWLILAIGLWWFGELRKKAAEYRIEQT